MSTFQQPARWYGEQAPEALDHRLHAAREWALSDRLFWFTVVAATFLGAALRLPPVVSADFPVNDGGLFYLMAEELRHAGYRIPAFTSYNGAHLPFAYPPVGFYLADFLAALTGAPLLGVLRVVPAVCSVLTIPVFALLARGLLRSRLEASVAVVTFALLPRTFTWFIMGGGLTRAPGFLLALLTVQQAHRMYTRGDWRYAVTTAVVGALAVMTHVENAWFAVYSAGFMLAFFGRTRRAVLQTAAVALGVVLLTAPWWATVVGYHGWTPFLSAAQGGGYGSFDWRPIKTLDFTDESALKVAGVLGLLGAFACVARRQVLLPVWLAAMFVINPRNPSTPATVPLAMLVGVAVAQLIIPGLLHLADVPPGPARNTYVARWRVGFVAACLGLLVSYEFLQTRALRKWDSGYTVLPLAERDAMRWTREHTPDSSRVLVAAFTPSWFGVDQTSEWFPALAERPSIATVQAYEWLPGRQFNRRTDRYNELHKCGSRDVRCLEQWAAAGGLSFTHVYIKKEGCCDALVASLRNSSAYRRVFENAGAIVFEHEGPGGVPLAARGQGRS